MKSISSQATPKDILFVEGNRDQTIGGSYYSLFFLIKHLDRSRYRPHAVFYGNHYLLQEFKDICESVIVLPVPVPFNLDKYLQQSKIPKVIKSSFGRLFKILQKGFNFFFHSIYPIFSNWRLLKQNSIQLVHLNNAVFVNHEWIFAAKLNRTICITHQRGMEDTGIPKMTYLYVRLLNGVISVSQAVHAFLQQKKLISRRNIVVHNATDIHSFVPQKSKEALSRELNITGGGPVFGIIGNIRPWKGQRIVCEAVNQLRSDFPDCRCLIVGDISSNANDVDYYRNLRQFIQEHSLEKNILFTGFQRDVASIIQLLDILVHASIDPEPFGRVIIEGMVMKKPVIATDIGGPKEIIQNYHNGILVPPGDPEKLAEAILEVVSNPDLADLLSENAFSTVKEKFSIHSHVHSIMSFYDELIDPTSIVEKEKAEKIVRQVSRHISAADEDLPDTAIQIHACNSPGWSSRRYFVSRLSMNGRYDHYLFKEYAIHDKTIPEIERLIENEYHGLQLAQKQFAESSLYCSPAPVSVLPEEQWIMMEMIQGQNLLTVINQHLGKTGLTGISEAISYYCFRAGEMLHTFQRDTFQRVDYDAEDEVHREIFDTGFGAIQELKKAGFPEEILTRYRSFLFELKERYHTEVLSAVHWDFRPQNIMIEENSNRLVLIDFQLFSERGNPYRDLATFLLAIISYDFLYARKKNLIELMSRFMDGYQQYGYPFAGFSLEMLDLILMVRFPVVVLSMLNPNSNSLIRKFRNGLMVRLYRKKLHRMLKTRSLLRDYKLL